MKELIIKQVDGGYSLEFSASFDRRNSIHTTLVDVFTKLLEVFEKRTEKGKKESYGIVIVKRVKDIPKDIIDKQKANVESVTGPPTIEEKVKHEDIIQFGEKKGAVEKIKEAEKDEK